MLGGSALAKMGQLCWNTRLNIQNCINIFLIKPVHSRSEVEISAVHVIEFFVLYCSPL